MRNSKSKPVARRPPARPAADSIKNSVQFFLWDYESTLFPLRTNRLLVEKFSTNLLDFIAETVSPTGSGFQTQHRVFASKRGWFLRPTVKLDPVAEYFIYDLIYRNRSLFRISLPSARKTYGFRIVSGKPISILKSYSDFKKAIAQQRPQFQRVAPILISRHISITSIIMISSDGLMSLAQRLKT